MKKYEFTGETMQFEGRTLRRIRYLRDLDYAVSLKNLLGGWIEHERNLSHEGNAIVFGEAKVFGNARIFENGHIEDYAIVKDNAIVCGNSRVYDNAIVGADSIVDDLTWIRGGSKVFFYHTTETMLMDDDNIQRANILGDTLIAGDTVIEGTGVVSDSEIISSYVYGDVQIRNKLLEFERDFV